MSNAKWFVFGLCFLAIMAAVGVWWVENKVNQVTNSINGAVSTVNKPFEAVSEMASNFDENVLKPVNDDCLEPAGDAFDSAILAPIAKALGFQEHRYNRGLSKVRP